MVNYIFGSLQASSDAVRIIKKTLSRQARVNRAYMIFALAVTSYTIVAEIRSCEQEKKIEELSKEIKELKCIKGE